MSTKDRISIEKTKDNSDILLKVKSVDLINQNMTKMVQNLHHPLINIKVLKIEISLMKTKNRDKGTISKILVEI